ncbi:MAG: PKD domain-containing protein [Phycisphaerae bacterium]|nr:PKD domain-containing protein [Phycisphaerae bacterium]
MHSPFRRFSRIALVACLIMTGACDLTQFVRQLPIIGDIITGGSPPPGTTQPGTPDEEPVFIPPDAIRLILINDSGLFARCEVGFEVAGRELRRTIVVLTPSGENSVSRFVPTVADRITLLARVQTAPDATGATLLDAAFTQGADYQPGQNFTVHVPSINQLPIAHAGADQSVLTGSIVTLDGSGSSDPDGDPLQFAWTQTSGPPVTLSNDMIAQPQFAAPAVAPGSTVGLDFQLIVTDPLGGMGADDVHIDVFAPLPVVVSVDAAPPTIVAGATTTLTATITGGTPPYVLAWSVQPPAGNSNGTLGPPDQNPTTWTAPFNEAGVWTLTALATDSAGSSGAGSALVTVVPDCNTNGFPDICEPDCDFNGTPDACELATFDCNTNNILDACEFSFFADCNTNRTPDVCETIPDCNTNGTHDACDVVFSSRDCDFNGTVDVCEAFPDCNTNGVPDACEFPDCDGNDVPDVCEIAARDCNTNGILDPCESSAIDCDFNDTPDICEGGFPDCNTNGRHDACEFPDCNNNDVPDVCDLSTNDCNTNNVVDECESFFNDCDFNDTPDVCEGFADCNTNGISDVCDAFSTDCDGNGTPDECDLAAGSTDDCNTNGLSDSCELSFFADCAGNGTLDICEAITDCNTNGTDDLCDGFVFGRDCDANGTPDACEGFPDCNTNNRHDDCDSPDCNTNDTPDSCELAGNDCNTNLQLDPCEGTFTDCDQNDTPDLCEGGFPDCNTNGRHDACEFPDCNNNDVPDVCELTGNDCNTNGLHDACESDCNTNGTADVCELAGNDCNTNNFLDECEVNFTFDCNTNGLLDVCEIVGLAMAEPWNLLEAAYAAVPLESSRHGSDEGLGRPSCGPAVRMDAWLPTWLASTRSNAMQSVTSPDVSTANEIVVWGPIPLDSGSRVQSPVAAPPAATWSMFHRLTELFAQRSDTHKTMRTQAVESTR